MLPILCLVGWLVIMSFLSRWLTGRENAIAVELRAFKTEMQTAFRTLNQKVEKLMVDYTNLAAKVAKTVDVEESATMVLTSLRSDLAALRAQLASQGADTSAVADMESKLGAATDKLAAAIASTGDTASSTDAPAGSTDAPAPAPADDPNAPASSSDA